MKQAAGWAVFAIGLVLAGASFFIRDPASISMLEDTFFGKAWFPWAVGAAGVILGSAGWAWAHGDSLSDL
ncbi:MAG: hypothetical protein QOJ67_2518 [Acidimicrobiaceae bacterium]|jgi:hypothetical protein